MILYNCVCRACGGEWDMHLPVEESAPRCLYCNSDDTYRAIGNVGFSLKGGRWAYDGYAQPPGVIHKNIGAPSPEEKRKAKRVIADRIEQGHEARRAAGKPLVR